MLKKILALAAMMQLVSGAVLAKHEYVAVNRQELLQRSKQGQQLRAELQAQAAELQAEQQKLIASIQAEEKELQKTLVALSKPAQEAKIAQLRKKANKIQGQIQEMTADFNGEAELMQKELDQHNILVASALLKENDWGMLVDANSALALNPELDKTEVILARLDAEFDAQQKTAAEKTVLEA